MCSLLLNTYRKVLQEICSKTNHQKEKQEPPSKYSSQAARKLPDYKIKLIFMLSSQKNILKLRYSLWTKIKSKAWLLNHSRRDKDQMFYRKSWSYGKDPIRSVATTLKNITQWLLVDLSAEQNLL